MKRRQFFQNFALITSSALAECATPGIAANSHKSPFSVPARWGTPQAVRAQPHPLQIRPTTRAIFF